MNIKLVRAGIIFGITFIFSLLCTGSSLSPAQQQAPPSRETGAGLLRLLGVEPSPESIDFVQNKTQFQLHTLLTEQRHPKTWNLSERVRKDVADGLRLLFLVDEDIAIQLEAPAARTQLLEQAVAAVEEAILQKKKIYIYGCGATGRLAKQMESTFWRPFWKKVKETEKVWIKLKPHLDEAVEDELIGEMTGADRALISSLEGFEDLQLIGRLQLHDRGIRKDDVVICVTEGGETSAVIGTILAALDQWKKEPGYDPLASRKKLYFVYNNPDERLLPFWRSRTVIEEPGITKVNLTTGPQAITGSTRMQATTIETFVVGNILETAVERVLRRFLSRKEMERLGFKRELLLAERLKAFPSVLAEIKKNIPGLALLTGLEARTYDSGGFSTYFAREGLITVFIDSTERSPTFRLFPLDTVNEAQRKCWIQVWTQAADLKQAWQVFLGRPFRGLSPEIYQKPFEAEVEDPYLRTAALASLKKAGDDQQYLYDFSFAGLNLNRRGPKKGDLGVMVLIAPEDAELKKKDSAFRKFLDLFKQAGAAIALILITDKPGTEAASLLAKFPGPVVHLVIGSDDDPFGIRQQVGLKMVLNSHSTAVMAILDRVVGNTMTNVSPSNLKLIGRATYLIQSHVNDVLSRPEWVQRHGLRWPISYGEANVVLFETIAFLKDKTQAAGQTAEVALSIIRILESLRQKRGLSPDEALNIVQKVGLGRYLTTVTQPSK